VRTESEAIALLQVTPRIPSSLDQITKEALVTSADQLIHQ
jgi:hypothetical protein